MKQREIVLFLHPGLQSNRPYPIRAKREHLGIAYLLSVLRTRGCDASVIDGDIADLGPAELLEEALKLNADVVGIAVSSQLLAPECHELARALKAERPSAKIMVGGHFPSLAHDRVIREWECVDVIVRGEAEDRIADICMALRGRGRLERIPGIDYRADGHTCSTGNPSLVENLDVLPFPARDSLNAVLRLRQPASLLGSRGCYGSCPFCTQRAFYGKSSWRPRQPRLVLEEMDDLVTRYGAHRMRFYDDNFMGPRERGRAHATSIARGMLERRLNVSFEIYCRANDIEGRTFALMRDAGLRAVTCGIESGSDAALVRLGKRTSVVMNHRAVTTLRSLGIQLKSAFIVFEPGATLDDIEANLDLLGEIGTDQPANYLFFADEEALPYYGTPFTDDLRERGLLKGSEWYQIPQYRFIDERVQALFEVVLALREETHELQRYWVEFTLRLEEIDAPPGLREETATIAAEVVRIPWTNVRQALDGVRRSNYVEDIVRHLSSGTVPLLDKCEVIRTRWVRWDIEKIGDQMTSHY